LNVADKRQCIKFFEKKVKVSWLLRWSEAPKSSYYYRVLTGRRGRKPSTHTLLSDGNTISNKSVVIAIRFILAEEFVCFGYDKITDDLRSNNFIINPKKTYRLMKESRLLCGVVIKAAGSKRRFVQWRVQQANKPMEQLCMDIKYVYIHGIKRNALLLTILDVYTRSIVGQVLWWRIRKENVIWLLHQVLQQHLVKGVTLRNDNGSQFIAHAVRDYLQEQEVVQEFIHVSTPQENSFIEAYHSIIDRELLQPRQFATIEEAVETFTRWRQFYNQRRLHGSLNNKTPAEIWNRYEEQMLNREQKMSICTEALSTNGERKSPQIEVSRLVDKVVENQKLAILEHQKQTNCFEKSVQFLGG
jgi:transposase InsO family protein